MADRPTPLQSEGWLREQYEVRQLTIRAIADLTTTDRQAVSAALVAHGIPTRTGAPVKLRNVGRVRLLVMAREEGSLTALARKLDVGRMTLYTHVVRVGLTVEEIQNAAREGRQDRHREAAKLYRKGLTVAQISKIMGQHPSSIYRAVAEQGALRPGHRNTAGPRRRPLRGSPVPREVARDLVALRASGVHVAAEIDGTLYTLQAAAYEPPEEDGEGNVVEVGSGTLWLALEEF